MQEQALTTDKPLVIITGASSIHKNMGITFEEYCQMLGNPDFMEPEQVAEIILYCWKLAANICIRDLVVAPTKTTF